MIANTQRCSAGGVHWARCWSTTPSRLTAPQSNSRYAALASLIEPSCRGRLSSGALAIAAMVLQTARHMTDTWYGALHDGQFDYQSFRWRVPEFDGYTTRTVGLRVPRAAVYETLGRARVTLVRAGRAETKDVERKRDDEEHAGEDHHRHPEIRALPQLAEVGARLRVSLLAPVPPPAPKDGETSRVVAKVPLRLELGPESAAVVRVMRRLRTVKPYRDYPKIPLPTELPAAARSLDEAAKALRRNKQLGRRPSRVMCED